MITTCVWIRLVDRHLFTPQHFKTVIIITDNVGVSACSCVLNLALDNMKHERSAQDGSQTDPRFNMLYKEYP